MLDGLVVLADAHVIHCDLKPENILLTNLQSSKNLIKLIDFGSACFENETVYSYIQSRFYRSPEVLFGLEYNMAIDMWSLGCICAELFLGLPLFPGASQYNQVCRLIEMLGMPPDHLIENGKFSHKYFKRKQKPSLQEGCNFELKSEEEYCRENNCEPKEWKRYFNFTQIDELIKNYSMKNVSPDIRQQEEKSRIALVDLLKGLLQWDPNVRWTARQTKQHPFVTGQPFTEPFVPDPDPSKVPLALRRHGTQPTPVVTQPQPQPYQQYNPHMGYFTPPTQGYLPSPQGGFMGGFVGPNLGPSPNTAFFQGSHTHDVVSSSNHTPGGIPIQTNSYQQQPMLMNSPGSYGQWNMMPHMYGTPSAHGSSPYVQQSPHHSRRGSGGSHLQMNPNSPNEDLSTGRPRKDSYRKNNGFNQQPQQSGGNQRRQSFKQQLHVESVGTPQQSSPQSLKPPKHPTRGKGNSYGSYKGRQYLQEHHDKQVSPITMEEGGPDESTMFYFEDDQEQSPPQPYRKQQPQQQQHSNNNPYYSGRGGRKGSTGGTRPRGNSNYNDFAMYGGGLSGTDVMSSPYGASPGNTATGLLGSSYSSSGMSVPSSVNSAYVPPSPQQQQFMQYKTSGYGSSPQNAGSLLSASFNDKKKKDKK
jgi:serine/threonine protein kinase